MYLCDMLEIILLAVVVLFLFKKFKSILGEEYDSEMFGYDAIVIVKKKIKEAIKVDVKDELLKDDFKGLDENSKKYAVELSEKISGFSLEKFTKISSKVLENVLKATNEQNVEEIKKFFSKKLADNIISSFNNDIRDNIVLVAMNNVEIENIAKNGSIYSINVIFTMQQINYTTKNEDGVENVVDGSKHEILDVKEKWNFVHNMNSGNNTWFIDKVDEVL